MKHRDLHEAMDACRHGAEDLHLPELRKLAAEMEGDDQLRQVFRRRQQIDQRIAAGLQQVELSPERRVRLLRAARSVSEAASLGMPSRVPVRHAPTRQRRLTLAAIGLTALSIVLMVTLSWRWLDPWRTASPQLLARWAMDDWSPSPRAWRPMSELSYEQRRAVSRFVRVRPARWQLLSTPLDHRTLVYDLPGHAQPTHLFVLQAGRRVKHLPNRPPPQPQTAYEGWLFAAWQETTHVFVLAVGGPTQHYRDVVRTPGHSLARTADRTASR